MARDSKGITQFLPATHARTIPAFTNQPHSTTALWLVGYCAYPSGIDGQSELTWMGWLVIYRPTEIDLPAPGVESRTRSGFAVLCVLFSRKLDHVTAAD